MAQDPDGCGTEIPHAAMWRDVVDARESRCFETYVPAAGILVSEVSVPAWSSAEPKLEVVGGQPELEGEDAARFTYLDRSPTGALLEVRAPGEYLVCVDAQQPERRLDEYKLAIGFAQAQPAGAPVLKEGDPEEDEPDPDTDPLRLDCSASVARRAVRELCHRSLADDHGDTLRCATPVRPGRELTAEIRNGLGTDDDVFLFTLDELRTMSIESAGDLDTYGALYDHRGYRLKSGDHGGEGGNLRIVKTLAPGRYFVRVGSRDGMEGSYRLIVEALSR